MELQLERALVELVGQHVGLLCKQLEAAKEVSEVRKLLRSAVDALFSHHFALLADALLSVVAPEWLACFPTRDRAALFDIFFERAPSAALLQALVAHLSTVQLLPGAPSRRDGAALVTAVAADVAAAHLAARFAGPTSSGVADLGRHMAVRYLLADKLLLQRAALKLAQAWGSEATTQRLPSQQQAYMTAALGDLLARLGGPALERTPGLLPALIAGVGTRLDSPLPSVRRQGMRVGNCFSRVLDPARAPLFGDEESCAPLPDEGWPEPVELPGRRAGNRGGAERLDGIAAEPPAPPQVDPDEPAASAWATGATWGDLACAAREDVGRPVSETDSDDDSLQPYDLSEGPDEGPDGGDRPVQLREVAAALRKADDPQALLKALAAVQPLIEAEPVELSHYAGELARALLYTRAPDWAEREAERDEDRPETQRLGATVALLSAAPAPAGATLVDQAFSPHLDLHQRLFILESLASSARALTRSPVGVSRRWGVRALAKLQAPPARTRRNRFPEVAAAWTEGLLAGCHAETHGVDLFGRDALLLGRLLTTLGTLVECAAPAPVTAHLAAAVLELLSAPSVHAHPQPFVRRSALVAASQVVGALPSARLAGALAGGPGGESDLGLLTRLEWLRGWAARAAQADEDGHCRLLASACLSMQGRLAAEALAVMDSGEDLRVGLEAPQIVMPSSTSMSTSIAF
ncbi:hypothetical protein WJX81_003452 [Elliptochloris bilobata]|uniref:Telomere length regulation protein conserved domain-containing protein n=1 Tax=Elliptochloris bilobata TaxID=381761 RepID=A0AAW1QMK8_9CHLO